MGRGGPPPIHPHERITLTTADERAKNRRAATPNSKICRVVKMCHLPGKAQGKRTRMIEHWPVKWPFSAFFDKCTCLEWKFAKCRQLNQTVRHALKIDKSASLVKFSRDRHGANRCRSRYFRGNCRGRAPPQLNVQRSSNDARLHAAFDPKLSSARLKGVIPP